MRWSDAAVAVVGTYQTRQARRLEGATSWSLAVEAMGGALADAGLGVGDVDGFNVQVGSTPASNDVGYQVGAGFFWTGKAYVGPEGVVEAAAAMRSGQCEVVLLASAQAGLHTEGAATAPWTRPANEFVETWGLHTPAELALLARRHMHLFGTTEEQAARVAAVIRNNGSKNPEAVYHGRGPFTVEDVLASPMIASPFRRLDCSMTAEGGAALVVTTLERARDLRRPPVQVLGGAVEQWGPEYTYPPTYERKGLLGKRPADVAFGQAGIERTDVDVLELYDNFSWEIIRYLEAFGFCEVGEGGPFVASGAIDLDGSHPVATDGGLLAHSHTGGSQGLQRVIEAVRQVRGDAVNQIDGAEVALASRPYSVLLLGAAR